LWWATPVVSAGSVAKGGAAVITYTGYLDHRAATSLATRRDIAGHRPKPTDAPFMEITDDFTVQARQPDELSGEGGGLRRSEPTPPADLEKARRIDAILRSVPRITPVGRSTSFPHLTALVDDDAKKRTDRARQLLFVAATIHVTADERRTAEYLLRHARELAAGRRSALSLLLSARCAAEMDVRRLRSVEIATALPAPAILAASQPISRPDDPSVGEVVLDFLSGAIGGFPAAPTTRSRLLDAVAVVVELSERHALNGGVRPSFVAMRSDARKESRLVTALDAEFGNPIAARGMARLLVGADRSPFESSLLWWAAKRDSTPDAVPQQIKSRWRRELAITDRALQHEARPLTWPVMLSAAM
jgi:hypothetical protein